MTRMQLDRTTHKEAATASPRKSGRPGLPLLLRPETILPNGTAAHRPTLLTDEPLTGRAPRRTGRRTAHLPGTRQGTEQDKEQGEPDTKETRRKPDGEGRGEQAEGQPPPPRDTEEAADPSGQRARGEKETTRREHTKPPD